MKRAAQKLWWTLRPPLRSAHPGPQIPSLHFFALRRFADSAASAVVGAASLPSAPIAAQECLEGIRRLLAAAEAASIQPERLFEVAQAHDFLLDIGAGCQGFESQQIRELLEEFARAHHMPEVLWPGGLSSEVIRTMEELPDLHMVHVALLLARMQLREPQELLMEVAELLELRAPDLSPQGLTGAAMALSQLGPWPDPQAGAPIFDQLVECMDKLNAREASAAALAAATLGTSASLFWQRAHGVLLDLVPTMAPRHIADTLLALATTQLCPITLLEALQQQLHSTAWKMDFDEAITTAWALCAMQLYPPGCLTKFLTRVLAHGADVGGSEARQLRQIALSLRLDPAAAKAKEALPLHLQESLERQDPMAEECSPAEAAVAEELVELFGEDQGLQVTLSDLVEDFYTVVMVVSGYVNMPQLGIVLDSSSQAYADVPHDPWTTLKCRHLRLLGWSVIWLPTRRWNAFSAQEKMTFISKIRAQSSLADV